MMWLVFTLVSPNVVMDVDHKRFTSYTTCEQYVNQLHSIKPKSCFTQFAKFKQRKKVRK